MPLGIDRDAGMMVLLARMVRRHQMLAPVLDPFDRAAQPQRGETHQEILGVKLAADAEAAAGVALLQHHRGGSAAEHPGQRVAVAMRHLGRAIQLQHVARGVEAGQRAARLQRRAAVPADRQVERDDGMSRGESGIDLAIAGAHHQRLGRQPGGKPARRRLGIEHRHQFLGLDDNEIGRVLGEVGVGREHRRDRLADIAQPVLR